MDVERCFSSLGTSADHPASTHSSRSSTPFAFPFPSFANSLLEDTSSRLLGLLHPALFADESFRCPICLAAFPSIWLLEQHTALQHVALGHFSSEDKPFVCDQCGQSYRYRSAYIKHREQNHRARLPADKLFSCDVCGMQFRYLKSFKKHRLNHALERLHGKSTDIISSGVSEAANISNSYDSDAPSVENTVSNDATGESSNNQVSSSNENITMEDNDVTITIKKETLYPDEEITEENVASASTEKPAENNCDQDDTIDSIGFSLTTNAPSSSEACRSAQETSILNFLRMDAAERQRERRFACPFCGKCVRSKENLKLHVRKHTGERPFVCLFCGRAFGGKSDLTRHLRIHTGERPYHCEMCGKCFARADYLSKHLTTHIHTPR